MKNKGISLIILIITIIVMVILAGTAINMMNNSDTMKKAMEAKRKMNLKTMEETAQVAFSEITLEKKDTKNINGNDIINKMLEDGITEQQLADYYILCADGKVIVEDVKREEVTKENLQLDIDNESIKIEDNTYNIDLVYDDKRDSSISANGEIVIPSKIEGYFIKNASIHIANNKIKKIYLSDGIETIILLNECDYGNDSVEIVYLPQSINGFQILGYSKLKSITIPINITFPDSLPYYDLWENSNLQSITIPYGINEIPYETFNNCTGLQSITIPKSVDTVYVSAFNGCTNLTVNVAWKKDEKPAGWENDWDSDVKAVNYAK